MKRSICLLWLLCVALPAWSGDLLQQIAARTPFHYAFPPGFHAPDGAELYLTGNNPSASNVTLVLRIDDANSTSYRTRVNDERVLPPGDFVLRFPLSGLRTLSKRTLDLQQLKQLMLFVGDGQPHVQLTALKVTQGVVFAPNVIAWDFGSAESPLFPGFTRITAQHAAVTGAHVQSVVRAGGDALLRDGLKGVESLHVDAPPGKWRVQLWTQDLGEWEYLPHYLKKEIRANGQLVYAMQKTAAQLLATAYLAGRDRELLPGMDAWQLFAKRRGGLVEFAVQVRDAGLDLVFTGDSLDAKFISGLLLWPEGSGDAGAQLEQWRRERFLETWRSSAAVGGVAVSVLDTAGFKPALAAPDSTLSLETTVNTPWDDEQPAVVVEPPSFHGETLPTELRYGQWLYERPNASATLLTPSDAMLRGDVTQLRFYAGLPRRLHLRISVPATAKPGIYQGRVQLLSRNEFKILPLTVHVLAQKLPPVDRPIGIYLERAPQWAWFRDFANADAQSLQCDVRTLQNLGVSGMAPPLATPLAGSEQLFINDLLNAQQHGLHAPLLAYTPVKRLAQSMNATSLAQQLAKTMTQAQVQGALSPTWSIADEPQQDEAEQIRQLASALHFAMPNAKVAAHLNQPWQEALLSSIDIALINEGFGADKNHLDAVRDAKVEPWLYNLGNERIAAGFYSWRVNALGYLQWHGRMPTADPFDPTDGRESDSQLIFPTKEPCPNVLDVHARLFALADGIVDLRWMLWLSEKARSNANAAALLQQLQNEIPTRWQDAKRLDNEWAEGVRRRIEGLATR